MIIWNEQVNTKHWKEYYKTEYIENKHILIILRYTETQLYKAKNENNLTNSTLS